jgi:hypothetical protein
LRVAETNDPVVGLAKAPLTIGASFVDDFPASEPKKHPGFVNNF